jgi:hypothetical protein
MRLGIVMAVAGDRPPLAEAEDLHDCDVISIPKGVELGTSPSCEVDHESQHLIIVPQPNTHQTRRSNVCSIEKCLCIGTDCAQFIPSRLFSFQYRQCKCSRGCGKVGWRCEQGA